MPFRGFVQEAPKDVEVERPAPPKPPGFKYSSDGQFLAYGVPCEWLVDVRTVTEDTLIEVDGHLPTEASLVLKIGTENALVFVEPVDSRERPPPRRTPGGVPRPQLTSALMMVSSGPGCWCRFGVGFGALGCHSVRNAGSPISFEINESAVQCDLSHQRAYSAHMRLRIWRTSPWGFESPLSH